MVAVVEQDPAQTLDVLGRERLDRALATLAGLADDAHRVGLRLAPLDRQREHGLQQDHGVAHRLGGHAVREQLRSPLGDQAGPIASSRRRPKRGPRRRSQMRWYSRSVDRASRLSASARYMGQNPASVRPEPSSAATTDAATGPPRASASTRRARSKSASSREAQRSRRRAPVAS